MGEKAPLEEGVMLAVLLVDCVGSGEGVGVKMPLAEGVSTGVGVGEKAPLAVGVSTGVDVGEGAPLEEGMTLAVLLVDCVGSGEWVGVGTPLADAHCVVEAVLVLQMDAVSLPAALPVGEKALLGLPAEDAEGMPLGEPETELMVETLGEPVAATEAVAAPGQWCTLWGWR